LNDDNNRHSQDGHSNHMKLMILMCLIPVLAIGAIRYFGLSANGLTNNYGLIFLVCPLMHIFMMGHGKEKQ